MRYPLHVQEPVAVPEDSLPLVLPDTDNFRPRGTPESPLSVIEDWVATLDPVGGGPARRETSTMPQVLHTLQDGSHQSFGSFNHGSFRMAHITPLGLSTLSVS